MPIFEAGVWYLTIDDLLAIHREVAALSQEQEVRLCGPGVLNTVALGSAAGEPRQTFQGAPLYPGIFVKAAAVARAIVCGHAFVDGNKRTGMDAALVFLRMNGYSICLGVEDFVAFALDIAGDRAKGKEPLALEGIAERLRAASGPIEPSF